MNILLQRLSLAFVAGLAISGGAFAAPASCDLLRSDEAKASELVAARQELVTRYQRELDGIKADAAVVFGDKLPAIEQRNRLASVAAKELRSLEPKAGKDAKARELQERIDGLAAKLKSNQQRSAKQMAAAQAKGPEAEASLERELRDESIRLNKELKALYAEQQAAHAAAVADPGLYALKRMQLRAAVRFTEIEDRQSLIDGVQKTLDEYKKRLDAVRAQKRAAECK